MSRHRRRGTTETHWHSPGPMGTGRALCFKSVRRLAFGARWSVSQRATGPQAPPSACASACARGITWATCGHMSETHVPMMRAINWASGRGRGRVRTSPDSVAIQCDDAQQWVTTCAWASRRPRKSGQSAAPLRLWPERRADMLMTCMPHPIHSMTVRLSVVTFQRLLALQTPLGARRSASATSLPPGPA